MPWTTSDNPAALFFIAHYILWAVGMLELEVEQELDAMTSPENWKLLTERFCQFTRPELRSRFNRLCETESDEAALDLLFQDVGLEKA